MSDQNYNGTNSTIISGLSEGTDYVFNVWAYDDYGNKSLASELTASTNHIPASPASLLQLKSDGSSQINNGGWTEEDNIKLSASVNDGDTSEVITL